MKRVRGGLPRGPGSGPARMTNWVTVGGIKGVVVAVRVTSQLGPLGLLRLGRGAGRMRRGRGLPAMVGVVGVGVGMTHSHPPKSPEGKVQGWGLGQLKGGCRGRQGHQQGQSRQRQAQGQAQGQRGHLRVCRPHQGPPQLPSSPSWPPLAPPAPAPHLRHRHPNQGRLVWGMGGCTESRWAGLGRAWGKWEGMGLHMAGHGAWGLMWPPTPEP